MARCLTHRAARIATKVGSYTILESLAAVGPEGIYELRL